MNKPIFESSKSRVAFDVLGDRYTMLLSSEETGGAYSMFEFEVPKAHGTPPHIHSREDESFFVLSGEVDFEIDGAVQRATAGDVVFAPRGIAHRFTGVSSAPARMICLASPGGFEKFFEAAGKICKDRSLPPAPPTDADIQRLMAVAPKFGLTLL